MIPIVLALLGTALMAVVIFAPAKTPSPTVAITAPPPFVTPWVRDEPPLPLSAFVPRSEASAPTWPLRVDPRANGIDAPGRIALVHALADVAQPWAEQILACAAMEEHDPAVLAVLAQRQPAYVSG
jgi:hypothetical protein